MIELWDGKEVDEGILDLINRAERISRGIRIDSRELDAMAYGAAINYARMNGLNIIDVGEPNGR